jgi:hypothetical protein
MSSVMSLQPLDEGFTDQRVADLLKIWIKEEFKQHVSARSNAEERNFQEIQGSALQHNGRRAAYERLLPKAQEQALKEVKNAKQAVLIANEKRRLREQEKAAMASKQPAPATTRKDGAAAAAAKKPFASFTFSFAKNDPFAMPQQPFARNQQNNTSVAARAPYKMAKNVSVHPTPAKPKLITEAVKEPKHEDFRAYDAEIENIAPMTMRVEGPKLEEFQDADCLDEEAPVDPNSEINLGPAESPDKRLQITMAQRIKAMRDDTPGISANQITRDLVKSGVSIDSAKVRKFLKKLSKHSQGEIGV